MVKNNINTNFENLKAEMMKKKEVAKDDKTENKYANVNSIKNENNNVNICDDEYEDVTSDSDINEVDTTSKDTSISQNKIVIKRAQKVQPPKRITYYLNQDTIKKIEKYSKLTGMGKSELVQTLLDISLNNLEIE